VPTPGSRDDAWASSLVYAIEDPAAFVDAAGVVVAWNEAAAAIGTAGPEAAGREPATLDNAAEWTAALRAELVEGGQILVWPAIATVGDEEIARQHARILERLAPGVAHDLLNQVGGIQSFVRVVGSGDERDRGLLEETAARAVETVKSFQDLVRTRRAGPAPVSVAALVAEALALARHPLQDVTVTVDVGDDLPDVVAEPGDLRQAVLAVLVNALDALGWPASRGELRVDARRSGARVELVIEDDAAAIPASELPRVLDPRPPRNSGRAPLDLAVARHLVRHWGGDLRVEAGRVRGNRFVLELPVGAGSLAGLAGAPAGDAAVDAPTTSTTPAIPAPAAARPEALPGAILVCDDDDSIRSLIVRVLHRADAAAIEAVSGEAALAILADRPVALVVADQSLGSMSGADLYWRAVEIRPELRGRFVLLSGDAGDPSVAALAREEGLRIVEKPFDVNELGAMIRRAATA